MNSNILATQAGELHDGLRAVGAGLAAIGVIGSGIGQGNAAAGGATAVGRNPEAAAQIRTIMLMGIAIAETAAIYAFLMSILILFIG